MDERRSTLSTVDRGVSDETEVSTRNFSAQATNGRNTKKLVPTTRMTMAPMAITTLP